MELHNLKINTTRRIRELENLKCARKKKELKNGRTREKKRERKRRYIDFVNLYYLI